MPSLPLPNDHNTDSVGGAAVTVKVTIGEVIALRVAVIELEPASRAVASPREPFALLIVATLVSDEAQVTVVVKT